MLICFVKKGFSIVEVLVASMVFSIAAIGIFSTIAAIRKPAAVSERKISAAYYGKRILDDLRAKTDARPGVWNGGVLGTSGSLPYTVVLSPVTISGTAFGASYTVTDATPAAIGAKEVRKVDLTVTWTEPP